MVAGTEIQVRPVVLRILLLLQVAPLWLVPHGQRVDAFLVDTSVGACSRRYGRKDFASFPNPSMTQLYEIMAGEEKQDNNTALQENANGKEIVTGDTDRPLVNGVYRATTTTSPVSKGSFSLDMVQGIGGKGGVVYDVNRLKRNLMQETMALYKEELWDLLGSSTPTTNDQQVVDKLVALVQASPVRTTTDSNLLDSQDDWVLAYRSQYPTTVESLVVDKGEVVANGNMPYNARYHFLWSATNNATNRGMDSKKSTFWERSVFWNKAKEFVQTKQRSFRLEELADDEDAYVKDTNFVLGGILTRTQRYALDGLTRSSLSLLPLATRWSLMGRWPPPHSNKSKKNAFGKSNSNPHVSVNIIYVDNDLCILTEEEGPDAPFMVYTRNKAYLDIYTCMKRKFKVLRTVVWRLVAEPLRRSPLVSHSESIRRKRRYGTAALDDPILKEIIQSESRGRTTTNNNNNPTKLRVLRLGDVSIDQEDESWESESDPFVHLSADERQQILKGMSVEEVERAADVYRNSQPRFRWIRKLLGRRRKQTFKKPPEAWQRPKRKR
jgi:hypothetical protein